jgi:antitoxin PrlF
MMQAAEPQAGKSPGLFSRNIFACDANTYPSFLFQYLDFNSMKSYYKCMKSIVSEKGQVTIPKACRDRLGLHAGSVLDFEARDGKLIAVKQQPEDVFRKWRGKGKLPGGLNVDRYLKMIRK